jgi:hypothetical protein
LVKFHREKSFFFVIFSQFEKCGKSEKCGKNVARSSKMWQMPRKCGKIATLSLGQKMTRRCEKLGYIVLRKFTFFDTDDFIPI